VSAIYHHETGFLIGDPKEAPFPQDYIPDPAGRKKALEPLILSASGWRKVFAEDDESRNIDLSLPDRELAAAMGEAFSDFLLRRTGKPSPRIAVGIDCRYTGPAMADILLRTFLSRGVEPRYLFITPAPEIIAYVKKSPELSGFAYISASHNPIGHNGLKFGLRGGVLGGTDSEILIRNFRELTEDEGRMENLISALKSVGAEKIEGVFLAAAEWKKEAEKAYEIFTRRVVTDREDPREQDAIIDRLRRGIEDRGCGILAEFNGSARTLGIDSNFLGSLGVEVKRVNGKPREITHPIVPEGASLDLCRRELEAARREDPRFIFGYVPDNDGDRGNIVYFDEALSKTGGSARILEAQEVFALACISELAFLAAEGRITDRTAVVVNDPTSLRVDRIARAFGAEVRRGEVGEANVVALANKLRDEGYGVRILGEGSNGGNITYPAQVRDPLNTIFALLKLLYLQSEKGEPGTFETWCIKLGRPDLYTPRPTLGSIMATLPRFTTLSAYEPAALLKIRTEDHGMLKARYEAVFLREWSRRREELSRRFDIVSWEVLNHEGIQERRGMGGNFRSGNQRGGLTVLLKDSGGTGRAFLWMRGSGTEPVFRILVDMEGSDPANFRYLLDWHRGMILEADGGLSN
jgi:phosphomannomutase